MNFFPGNAVKEEFPHFNVREDDNKLTVDENASVASKHADSNLRKRVLRKCSLCVDEIVAFYFFYFIFFCSR